MTIHFCAMCDFETDDEAQAYEHDCMATTADSAVVVGVESVEEK